MCQPPDTSCADVVFSVKVPEAWALPANKKTTAAQARAAIATRGRARRFRRMVRAKVQQRAGCTNVDTMWDAGHNFTDIGLMVLSKGPLLQTGNAGHMAEGG